jgi:hypothetical protein
MRRRRSVAGEDLRLLCFALDLRQRRGIILIDGSYLKVENRDVGNGAEALPIPGCVCYLFGLR